MRQELNGGAWWRMTMVKMTPLIAVMPTLLFQLFPVITLFWSVRCFLWPLRVRGPTQFSACNKLPLAATLSAAVRRQLWTGLSCARLQNPRVSVTEREYYLSRVSQHATRPQSSSDCPLIIPFTSRRIETYRPWKETVWLGCEYSEPKSPTGKLDFLSNLWALEPSTARGHGGDVCVHQQSSAYLHQRVFKRIGDSPMLNRLVPYITGTGSVIYSKVHRGGNSKWGEGHGHRFWIGRH